MFNFLRENSYTIVKMFLNQIGMTVFGIMLAMATKSNSTLLLITGLFSVGFYLFLLYSMMWEIGAKDKIRIDGGRAALDPCKGVYISLCANVINILTAVLIIISFYAMPSEIRTLVANGESIADEALLASTPAWASAVYQVCSAIFGFLNGMYTAVLKVFAPGFMPAKLITVIPTVASCAVGYLMGVKGMRFIPSNSGKPGKKEKPAPKSWGNNLKK